MPLTPLQRKVLIRYNDLRNRPVAWTDIYLRALPPMLVLGVTAGLAALVLPAALATLVAGMGLGATLRQIAIGRQTARILPALLAVIDWSRVATLLGESAPPSGQPSSTRAD